MGKKKVVAIVVTVAVIAASIGLVYYFYSGAPGVIVDFVQSFKDVPVFETNATRYDFHIVVPRQTTWTTPFGTAHEQMEKSLQPLISKYNLVSIEEDGMNTAMHESVFIQVGEATFSLYSYDPLSTEQVNSLSVDLRNAIATAPNY
jgi:hypothetical protein